MATLIDMIASGIENHKLAHRQHDEIFAGGPGSGRHGGGGSKKPSWQGDAPAGIKQLNDMHEALAKSGFKYKNSTSGGKGNINHTYKDSDNNTSVIHEKANGAHSMSKKYVGSDGPAWKR